MSQQDQDLIKQAYEAFNARDIDTALKLLHPDVKWVNVREGSYVCGHDEVSEYWKRQWKEINPTITPVSLQDTDDNKLKVEVHQTLKDLEGNVLFDGTVYHIYTFKNGIIGSMEIEKLYPHMKSQTGIPEVTVAGVYRKSLLQEI